MIRALIVFAEWNSSYQSSSSFPVGKLGMIGIVEYRLLVLKAGFFTLTKYQFRLPFGNLVVAFAVFFRAFSMSKFWSFAVGPDSLRC